MSKIKPPVDFDENPEWTEEDFARARPASEVHGVEFAAGMVRKRGRPPGSTGSNKKEQIALRVDADVLAAYKAGGPGWQTRMNDELRFAFHNFGVVEGRGTFAVVERKRWQAPSSTAIASFQGTAIIVAEYPTEAEAAADADRRNAELRERAA